MADTAKPFENPPPGLSARLVGVPANCRGNGQYAGAAGHFARGKRKRADGYSEADNRFIVQSVQSADQEGKPIPWEWIGSNLQRTTGAVKKQYQRIKPTLDKFSEQKLEQGPGTLAASKRSERIEKAKQRDGKKLPVLFTPDGDETSAEESHSSESQPQADAETTDVRQAKELRISSKDAWAAIVDSDVSIEVAANGLLALKSASPTSPDDDDFL